MGMPHHTSAALRAAVLSVLVLTIPSARAHGQTDAPQALTGVQSIVILIEHTSPETIAAGVDTAALRLNAETTARRLGLRVVPAGSRDSADGVLYINAFAATNDQRDWYAANVELEIMQPVTIDRTPDARLFATTWQAPVRLSVVRAGELRAEVAQAVVSMLDELARAWSAANPGGGR